MSAPIKRNEDSAKVTIAASGTASDSIEAKGDAWGSFQLPSAFTGTAVTAQYSNDNTNWTAVQASSGESNPITVTADGTYALPALTCAAKYFRLVSGSSEAAAREITIHLKS